MKQDERAPFVKALRRARESAYPPGGFVDQEGFMRAGEIRALATQAGIVPGVSVLDLCCGVAGPGRFIARELGCVYLGVDSSASALGIARDRAGDLPCHFKVSRIPPIPPGPFDVVLLFETMLAFPEKEPLLQGIAGALTSGGRFAFTMEEGLPLTEAERARMPDADTVWLTPLSQMLTCLERAGLVVRWQNDCSRSHCAVADSLINAFAADANDIAAQIGHRALEELLAAHRLWRGWLREGRVRKLAFVAEKTEKPPARARAGSSHLSLCVHGARARPRSRYHFGQMDFPQTHHTNTGRAVVVNRTDEGALTFSDGAAHLATLTPGGDGWHLTLPDGEARALPAAHGDPPISAVILQIDLHEDENDDTSGVED